MPYETDRRPDRPEGRPRVPREPEERLPWHVIARVQAYGKVGLVVLVAWYGAQVLREEYPPPTALQALLALGVVILLLRFFLPHRPSGTTEDDEPPAGR